MKDPYKVVSKHIFCAKPSPLAEGGQRHQIIILANNLTDAEYIANRFYKDEYAVVRRLASTSAKDVFVSPF